MNDTEEEYDSDAADAADAEQIELLVELQAAHEAEVLRYAKGYEAKMAAAAALHAREVGDLKREIAEVKADRAIETARLHELLVKALQEKAPANVTIADGAIQVSVAPPNLTVSEGAIQALITNQPASADLEILHPGGQKTTLRRR